MPAFLLTDELVFPPVHLSTREGLIAIGGDLSTDRLLLAYSKGIFPWFSDDEPILWWSPDPRMVLYPREFYTSRSLSKAIRKDSYQITFDGAFDRVIAACANTRRGGSEGTWITSEMQIAYFRLFELGYAHSVEAWHQGELVGGLYGVSLGRMFFGESMFSTMRDASKVCLSHMVAFASRNKFFLIDCQVPTDHLKSMGARNIPRKEFIATLDQALSFPTLTGHWAE